MPAPDPGATPTELRLRVLANGWHPLPVVGKAPTPNGWTRYCRTPPTGDEIAFWGRSHPGALSTGLALGEEVAVDIDVASNALLAEAVRGIAEEVFGPTPFVRVGRAPKVALVYRAGPGIASTSHKAADGSGDGIDILADGRQVVGFGRHKDTGQFYAWTGEASPLDARPDAAPVITPAQVAEFLARVETVMPLGGGASRSGGSGKGSSEEIVRGASGLVVNGRERFMTSCVWRAAHDLRTAGTDITAGVLADAAWALFADSERGADLGDGKWKKAHVAYKARATVRRLEAGKVELGQAARPDDAADDGAGVTPTYPDISVPVAEARAAVQGAVDAHFAAGVGRRAVRVGTGLGKTRAAVLAIVADIRRRRAEGDRSAALYLAPTLALADEVAELFRAAGVKASTFRGRGAEDPDAEGFRMCLDLESVELALKLDLTVSTACCKLKDRETGKAYLCPFYDACSYQRQKDESPDVWCATHDALFTPLPGLGEVGSVTIDEAFWQTGLRIAKRGVTLDEVGASPGVGKNNFEMMEAADVAAWRSQLVAALRRQEDPGGVARRHLVEGGITAELCSQANAAEWRLLGRVNFYPGMSKEARQAAARAAQAAGKIGKASAVWRAAGDLLEQEDEGAVSGRLVLVDRKTEEGTARAVLTHGVRKVLKRWMDLPVLLLDATLPPVEVLRCFFPDVEVVADVEGRAPHATVRQVVGAPVSRNRLLASEAGRNREAVRRAILHRWVRAGRCRTLVVCQKEAEEKLVALGLPAGIETAHFGAIAGLDGYKDAGLVIVIGRTLLDVFEAETYAGVLSGLEPLRTAEPTRSKLRFHDRVPLALRMADGTGRPVEGYRHPDPLAEATRWVVAEGGVLQAIGRARAVNRTAVDPVAVEVWSDLALPLTVDKAVAWDDVPAGREADMLADGVVLESAPDMARCWPGVWETDRAAVRWLQGSTDAQTAIRDILYSGLGICGAGRAEPAAFRYQHAGARQRWRRGWCDPAACADPRAWLELRLGRLAGFEDLPDDARAIQRTFHTG